MISGLGKMGGGAGKWLIEAIASPWLTMLFFVLTAAFVLLVKANAVEPTNAMLAPFTLLVINLGTSIVVHPRFRANFPLLIFHLSLLALVSLFLWGRLTYLNGMVNLTRGIPFSGALDAVEQGPWHQSTYAGLSFKHGGFRQYIVNAGGKYPETSSLIHWLDEGERWRQTELRDGYSLLLGDYRIYSSPRRGFSPVFLWQPDSGPSLMQTVQLLGPADRTMENTSDWVAPTGESAWIRLEKLSATMPPLGAVVENLGAADLSHRLVLRIGGQRHELALGESLNLPGGRLQYVRLETWMRYFLVQDVTQPWLIATIVLAMLSLGWFYLERFRKVPWEVK